jgi:hypothetical protein
MRTEINTIAYAHVVVMEFDESGKVKYCSCDIKDGKLRILFNPKELGCNINNLYEDLPKKLNEAEQPVGADGKAPVMGAQARLNISKEYNEQIKPVLEKLQKWFSPDFKLNPMFEENYIALKKVPAKEHSQGEEWEQKIGYLTWSYFDGAVYRFEYDKFDSDDMLREGFNEAIDKHEIAFRVVDKLKDGGYAECVIEDGILYLQVSTSMAGLMINEISDLF